MINAYRFRAPRKQERLTEQQANKPLFLGQFIMPDGACLHWGCLTRNFVSSGTWMTFGPVTSCLNLPGALSLSFMESWHLSYSLNSASLQGPLLSISPWSLSLLCIIFFVFAFSHSHMCPSPNYNSGTSVIQPLFIFYSNWAYLVLSKPRS